MAGASNRIAGKLPLAWLSMALTAALPQAARADDAASPMWTFGGFGTVGLVHSDARDADFSSTVLKAHGAGFSGSTSIDVDTRVGAQLGLNLNKQWSAVLQVISEHRIENTYNPIVEWGFVKYQATPDLSLRLGRIALPIFVAAEYRKAAYAFPWVRTPVEVYGAIPITNSDGIDVTYRWNVGAVKNVTQAFYGYNNVHTGTSRVKARGLGGVSNTTEVGAASARVSVLTTDLSVDLARALFDAFRQFGPQGVQIAEQYDVDHKQALGVSIGATYDPGEWFVMGEIGRLDAKSYLGDKTAAFVSAGYRYNNFTPYVSFARVKANSSITSPGLSLAGLPPQVAGAAAVLNATLNGLLSTIAVQSSSTIGLRWDFMRNVALKLQQERVQPKGASSGMLINVQPGFQYGRAVNATSVALDFVF